MESQVAGEGYALNFVVGVPAGRARVSGCEDARQWGAERR